MGKDKEKDPIDEAIDESFPASDPPSWTASDPRVTEPTASVRERLQRLQEAVQRNARAAAQELAKVPRGYLVGALAVAATAVGLLAAGKRRASLLTGVWAPAVLLAGLSARVARPAPAADRAHLH